MNHFSARPILQYSIRTLPLALASVLTACSMSTWQTSDAPRFSLQDPGMIAWQDRCDSPCTTDRMNAPMKLTLERQLAQSGGIVSFGEPPLDSQIEVTLPLGIQTKIQVPNMLTDSGQRWILLAGMPVRWQYQQMHSTHASVGSPGIAIPETIEETFVTYAVWDPRAKRLLKVGRVENEQRVAILGIPYRSKSKDEVHEDLGWQLLRSLPGKPFETHYRRTAKRGPYIHDNLQLRGTLDLPSAEMFQQQPIMEFSLGARVFRKIFVTGTCSLDDWGTGFGGGLRGYVLPWDMMVGASVLSMPEARHVNSYDGEDRMEVSDGITTTMEISKDFWVLPYLQAGLGTQWRLDGQGKSTFGLFLAATVD